MPALIPALRSGRDTPPMVRVRVRVRVRLRLRLSVSPPRLGSERREASAGRWARTQLQG